MDIPVVPTVDVAQDRRLTRTSDVVVAREATVRVGPLGEVSVLVSTPPTYPYMSGTPCVWRMSREYTFGSGKFSEHCNPVSGKFHTPQYKTIYIFVRQEVPSILRQSVRNTDFCVTE